MAINSQPRRKLPVALSTDYALQWLSPVALAIIALYRAVLSPVLFSIWGPTCRFEPTCSAYAAEAIARYGIARGGWMALKRLMRCRPLGGWGFDPLPKMNL
jgi:uncharacterized protein